MQLEISWSTYLARGVSSQAGIPTTALREDREEIVLAQLNAIFKDRLCLTPFSRTIAVEFVKKQVSQPGNHFDRVLPFILNTINNKPYRNIEQRGCPNMIPKLTARPFWDKAVLPWVSELEGKYLEIRNEFMRLKEMGNLFQPYRAPVTRGSSDGSTIGEIATSAGSWNVCYLRLHEMDFTETLQLCPVTDAAIKSIPRQYNHALFSALAPKTHVAPHYGPTNKKLRCHLPLVVPDCTACSITVNGQTEFMQEGKCIVFDDSFYHEASNMAEAPRVVLIIDVWHPDLSEEEVKFLSFLDKAQFRAAARHAAESGCQQDPMDGLKPEDSNFFNIITRAKQELRSPKMEIWG